MIDELIHEYSPDTEFEAEISTAEMTKQLKVWEHCSKCHGKACQYALRGLCPYRKSKEENPPGECFVERSFLRINLEALWPLIKKTNYDPIIMQMIGMHLIPLYVDLCKLNMEKLMIERTFYRVMGKVMVHPVFREIRETHKSITNVWRSMGLVTVAKQAGMMMPIITGLRVSETPVDEEEEAPKPGGYDQMAKMIDV